MKNVYGCACRSPEFGKLFRSDRQVLGRAAHAPPLVAMQEIGTDDVENRGQISVSANVERHSDNVR